MEQVSDETIQGLTRAERKNRGANHVQHEGLLRYECDIAACLPRRSHAEIQTNTTFRSRFSSAGSAIPISIRCATSGASHAHYIPDCPGHEIVAVSPRPAQQLPNTSLATSPRSDASSTRTAPAPVQGWPRAILREPDLTFNFPDKHLGGVTYAATPTASSSMNASCCAPSNLDLAEPRRSSAQDHHIFADAPLGRHKGQKVGVVGLGGLGHMGVKFAPCVRSPRRRLHHLAGKKEDAFRLARRSRRFPQCDEMKKHTGSFDFILDAVSAAHDINAYSQPARLDGNLTLVALREAPGVSAFASSWAAVISPDPHRRPPETQEMLDFCGAHHITADVEVIRSRKVNEATRDCSSRCEVPLLQLIWLLSV